MSAPNPDVRPQEEVGSRELGKAQRALNTRSGLPELRLLGPRGAHRPPRRMEAGHGASIQNPPEPGVGRPLPSQREGGILQEDRNLLRVGLKPGLHTPCQVPLQSCNQRGWWTQSPRPRSPHASHQPTVHQGDSRSRPHQAPPAELTRAAKSAMVRE